MRGRRSFVIGACAATLVLLTPGAAFSQVTIPTLPPVAPPPTTVPPAPTVPPSTEPSVPPSTEPTQPAATAPPSSAAPRVTAAPTRGSTTATPSTAATASTAPAGSASDTKVAVLPRPRSASELATTALHSAGEFTIPFVLGALVALFLLIQGRVHRGDAKLIAAPLTSDDALKFR